MKRRTRQTCNIVAVLLFLPLVTSCQTFRPRGYEPPKDSPEYIMKRDRGAQQSEHESSDLH